MQELKGVSRMLAGGGITCQIGAPMFRNVLRAGLVYVFIALCLFSNAARAQLPPFQPLESSHPIKVNVEGKQVEINIDSYHFENYNAHSFDIVVMYFYGDGNRKFFIPLELSGGRYDYYVTDAPGAGCLNNVAGWRLVDGRLELAIIHNSLDSAAPTEVMLFKLLSNFEAVPGDPPLYFKRVGRKDVQRICRPDEMGRINLE